MHIVPTLVALAVAVALTPRILRHLREEGMERENYRGVRLPFPAGIAVVAAVVMALVPLAVLGRIVSGGPSDVFPEGTWIVVVYGLGVALLGLIDDQLAGRSRGWRGHGAAVLGRGFSTGALKAVGTLGLALFVLGGWDTSDGDYVLEVALLVLTTNLFNLLDLRPGRAVKAFVLLGAGLLIGAGTAIGPHGILNVEMFGLLGAPVLVVGLFDVRERAMLGDTGANLIGGLAGLWLVYALGTLGRLVALAVVLAITVYGEFRSISALVERNPLLRWIDSIGRNPHA